MYHVQQLHCTTFYIIPPYIAMFQVPYILLPCASRSLIYFPCKQGFHIPHLHNTLISCSSPPPPTSFTYSHHTAHFATWAFHVREPFACFLHMNSMSQVWAPRGGGVIWHFTYVFHVHLYLTASFTWCFHANRSSPARAHIISMSMLPQDEGSGRLAGAFGLSHMFSM